MVEEHGGSFNLFLSTNDGLIAAKYIVRIGPPEQWPHGIFHKIIYGHGEAVLETRATDAEVRAFLKRSRK